MDGSVGSMVGVRVTVLVLVGEGVAVGVLVFLGVRVGDSVGVSVLVQVGVNVGVFVIVEVGGTVAVDDGEGVIVGVLVGDEVGLRVMVRVGVRVGVIVGVGDRVAVGSGVDGVGVAVGAEAVMVKLPLEMSKNIFEAAWILMRAVLVAGALTATTWLPSLSVLSAKR